MKAGKTCSAITQTGDMCTRRARPESDYCGQHEIPTIAQQWKDPEIQGMILREAEKSVPWEMVAMSAGIPRKAIKQWREAALRDDCPPDLAEFIRRVDQAAAKGGMMLHAIAITSPNSPAVSSARWMLERRFPDLYGPQQVDPVRAVALWEPFNAEEILAAIEPTKEAS